MSQFIGRRIVPVHGGVWDRTKSYEELTIVLHEASGDSYISRRPVPAGTVIGDTTYWMMYSLYSAQIHEAEQHLNEATEDVRNRISASEQKVSSALSATEKKVADELAATERKVADELAETERVVEQRTAAAEQLTSTNRAELDTRMDGIDKRLDANVAASTDKNADYAAEVVDARVDTNGQVYANLGEAIRRDDAALRSVQKVPIALGQKTLKGENKNESQGTVEKIMVGGRTVAADVRLSYIRPEGGGHFIRGFFTIPLADFQDQYSGHVLTVQIYSSEACDVLMGWGFSGAYKAGFTLQQIVHLKVGYNELQIDCDTEEFQSLTIPEDCTRFFLHYLFGAYGGMKNQPSDGNHLFRFSVYDNTEIGRALPGCDSVVLSAFSGYSDNARYADEAGHTSQADQAAEAVHAVKADKAQHSDTSDGAKNAGIVNAVKAMGFKCWLPDAVYSEESHEITIPVTRETKIGGDTGFSVQIGTTAELRGRDIIVYRDGEFTLSKIAMNAGKFWGGPTYVDVQDLFKDIEKGYYAASFDDIFQRLVDKEKTTEDYEDKFWLMIYNNQQWDLSTLEEGQESVSRYRVYVSTPGNLLYSQSNKELLQNLFSLNEKCSGMEEIIALLETELNSTKTSLESLKASNILWGKKWVACGDSFTEGDFSNAPDANWKDADGNKKVYPYFIGKRNNMTIVNEAKCGSIMSLDKSYVESPDTVSIATRNPFSLNRYKQIPEDADYITMWFGINDSGHTILGTIDDTSNDTFYGAWNVVLPYLIEHHPYAKIGIIITDRGNEKYRQATREVAIKWGIPYLDMMGDDRVPVMMYRETSLGLCKEAGDLRYNTFRVASNNGHPSWQAHEYQSTFIEHFLRSL